MEAAGFEPDFAVSQDFINVHEVAVNIGEYPLLKKCRHETKYTKHEEILSGIVRKLRVPS